MWLLAVLTVTAGVAMAIEEPEYRVVTQKGEYEIRQYPSIRVAEARVKEDFDQAGNRAFRLLAGYIFGKNDSETKMAMTAPVTQIPDGDTFVVQFVMEKKFDSLAALPVPKDTQVKLRELPPRKVAVLSYSGSWAKSKYDAKLAELRAALERDGFKTVGEPIFSRYNSPFSLWFLRRNEIWLEVEGAQ